MEFITKIKERRTIVGREEELALLKESFYKKRMKNTILVGNAGCGKTTLIEKLAYDLKNEYTFKELNLGAVLAGTKYRGDLEGKIISYFESIKNKPVVLFIDEIHSIVNCGGVEGAVGIDDIIKPYLSNGEITIIGATTPEEYKKTIYTDKALNRRLSPIFISDLDDDSIIKILDKFASKSVDKNLLKTIYSLTGSLDMSIEVLDRCLARNAMTGSQIDENMIYKIYERTKLPEENYEIHQTI